MKCHTHALARPPAVLVAAIEIPPQRLPAIVQVNKLQRQDSPPLERLNEL